MSLLQTIDGIYASPDVFFRPAKHSFSAVVGFFSGYESARFDHQIPAGADDEIVRFRFAPFVMRTLKTRFPDRSYGSGYSWFSVIARDTATDEEAFRLFAELWREFRHEHVALERV